jgi:YidC/Oxa1 family membrane protein insertase
MERGGLARWLLIGLGITLLLMFWNPFGTKEQGAQPIFAEAQKPAPEPRKPEQLCDVWHPTFRARLSTQGGGIKHFELLTAKYRKNNKPIDLSTTPDLEYYRQLRFHWRNEAVSFDPKYPLWQVDYDSVDFTITRADGKSCELVYRDAKVELKKVVRTTERPYELEAEATITNRSDKKLVHALTVHTDEWRTRHEIEPGMFQVSPFISHVETVLKNGDVVRLRPPDFEPEEFKPPAFAVNELNRGDWHQVPGENDIDAASNAYFTHAIAPLAAPKTPVSQLQIEERWDTARYKSASADPNGGAFYRARLAYPKLELEPNQSASYRVLTYVGPKERDVLAAAGGGPHKFSELIDLGFFSIIAKVLVAFLLKVYSVIPNWGIAIIVLTITARTLLFPLALPSIKGMIKMRELKPELDALNEKYKDDPQAKGLAQMELWRKHKVNPLKGCLPQLASMPVWFALYTTLQTAVELYNIPFLWFPDLSQPDGFYILPFIIGGTSFFQQKLMPMQGDPMQQKMLLYFMPAMFTVFMLFLPAGLGVYMFTNGVLGIAQQQIVEWHVRRSMRAGSGTGGGKEIEVKIKEEPSAKSGPKGKKAKSHDTEQDSERKLSDGRPLLGKGKA